MALKNVPGRRYFYTSPADHPPIKILKNSKLCHFLPANSLLTLHNNMSFARQADYDHLVKEMVSEGASVEEAAAEAEDTFRGSGFDLSALYLYQTAHELKDKEGVDLKFKTLEDKAAYANYVNSYMAIKALEKVLNTTNKKDKVYVGTLKLAEARKLLQSLLKIVDQAVASAADEEEEEDEDDEDAEENRIATKETLLAFSALVLKNGQATFLNYDASIALSQEHMTMLCKLCDQDSGEPRYN